MTLQAAKDTESGVGGKAKSGGVEGYGLFACKDTADRVILFQPLNNLKQWNQKRQQVVKR